MSSSKESRDKKPISRRKLLAGAGAIGGLFTDVAIDTVEAGENVDSVLINMANVNTGDELVIDGTTIDLTTDATTGTGTYNVTVGGGGTTLTIAHTGSGVPGATMAGIVNGITYNNTSQDPDTTARTFTRERRCTLAGYFRIV